MANEQGIAQPQPADIIVEGVWVSRESFGRGAAQVPWKRMSERVRAPYLAVLSELQ